MYVGEFACQSRSSATVCVCPVVVQCYCSMEPTPTSATLMASLPWTWLNPPPRQCSQVSFLSVYQSVKGHAHTFQHVHISFSVLMYLAFVMLQFACVFVIPVAVFSTTDAYFHICFNVHILSTTFSQHPFPHSVQGYSHYHLFFFPYPSITLLFCKAVLLMLTTFSRLVQGCAHSRHYITFCMFCSVLLSKAIISGQKCFCLCSLLSFPIVFCFFFDSSSG